MQRRWDIMVKHGCQCAQTHPFYRDGTQHFGLSLQAMRVQGSHPVLRLGDNRPMSGKGLIPIACLQSQERGHVICHIAIGR